LFFLGREPYEDSWGDACPPALLIWGGHCRLVVGVAVSEENVWSIFVLDPRFPEDPVELTAEKLAKKCRSGDYEAAFPRPSP